MGDPLKARIDEGVRLIRDALDKMVRPSAVDFVEAMGRLKSWSETAGAPLHNCHTCALANSRRTTCGVNDLPEVSRWIRDTHEPGSQVCPVSADGCPRYMYDGT